MDALFHYTTLDALPAIYRSGHLRRSRPGALGAGFVWFSSRDPWERVVGKVIETDEGDRFMTFEEMQRDGPFRFARFRLLTVLPAIEAYIPRRVCPTEVQEVKEVQEARRSLEELKRRAGIDPRDWFTCSHDVDLKHLALELWKDGGWRRESLPSRSRRPAPSRLIQTMISLSPTQRFGPS